MGKKQKSKKVQKSKSTKSTKSAKPKKQKSKKKKVAKKKKVVVRRKVIVGNPVRCKKQKSVRRKLYYEREKLIKEILSGVPPKRQDRINALLDKINAKIKDQTFKIFKCGKRYAKLRAERDTLVSKNRWLRHKYKTNASLSDKEKNAILTSIGKNNEAIRDLKAIMGSKMTEDPEGRKVSFQSDIVENTTSELTTIWQVKASVEGLIDSPDSKMVSMTVNGVLYDLKTNRLGAMWALDDFIAEITMSQANSNVKTPMVQITVDFNNFTIEIS